MGKRHDRRSAPSREASDTTIDDRASDRERPEGSPLDQELRDLYQRFGGDGEIPERLLDLAQKISDAYEKVVSVPSSSDTPGSRRGDA
jgi:hypothetical protein